MILLGNKERPLLLLPATFTMSTVTCPETDNPPDALAPGAANTTIEYTLKTAIATTVAMDLRRFLLFVGWQCSYFVNQLVFQICGHVPSPVSQKRKL
jgi:hypothetical protein